MSLQDSDTMSMYTGVLPHPTPVVIASKILLCEAAILLWADLQRCNSSPTFTSERSTKTSGWDLGQ